MKDSTKRILYTAATAIIVVFSTTFAILMTLERMDYRNYLQAEYNKNMYQLINSVENIGNNLAKVPVLGSKEQDIVVCDEIFRYSNVANDKLHSIPVSQDKLSATSKFLSQLGDFSYVLGNKISRGGELNNSEVAQVESLKLQAYNLENQLKSVQNDINNGRVRWGEIRQKASGVLASTSTPSVSDEFKGIQKQATQYPALVYDGPFSDNNMNIKPKILSQNKVSRAQAENVVKEAIGAKRIKRIEVKSDGNGIIPTYMFDVYMSGRNKSTEKITCEVSQNGGRMLSIIDNRVAGKPTMDINTASQIGRKYLNRIGYKNMFSTYVLNYNNVAVISYVNSSDNMLIYPDMIKLKVSMDDGNVVGLEADKYLRSNYNRTIPKPQITEAKARERVGKRLSIKSVRMAIVPTETNKEVLCYEFSGSYKGDDFIVYINANTGYETRILQIRNTPNGKLTM
ncbi:germination protein YpeB [Clostridium neuense]|uniref:Germination protein YpeB n=1 Tax=Clostridium neuense TaxID=1728934 RepID=A0ABW8TDH7_9CLOT